MYAKITNSTIVNSIVDILIFNMGGGGKSVKTQGTRPTQCQCNKNQGRCGHFEGGTVLWACHTTM